METNVTLVSIVIIVFLYFPGNIFKRFYFKGPFSQQFNIGIFAERFITSIFWGGIMQIISLITSKNFIDISYISLKQPIADFYFNLCNNKLPDLTFDNICNIGIFQTVTIFISAAMGYCLHTIVRLLKLDVAISAIRFHNHWHYYLKGEIVGKSNNPQLGRVLTTEVDILINDGNGSTKLYSGFLKDFTIANKSGDLETLTLSNTHRYSESRKDFIEVKGDLLVVPFKNVINFNLRFNRVERLPFISRLKTYFYLFLFISEVGIAFYIPIRFSSLGTFNVVCSIILYLLASFSFLLSVFSMLNEEQTVTKKAKNIVAFFFFIVSIILSIGFLATLQIL